MEPTRSRPAKKWPRRLIIASALLFIGLGTWFWPRADQRFVGNWSTTFGTAYVLHSDGSGTFFSFGSAVYPLRWWYGPWGLTVHYSSESRSQSLLEVLHEVTCAIRGVPSRGQMTHLKISESSANRITFADQTWLRTSPQD